MGLFGGGSNNDDNEVDIFFMKKNVLIAERLCVEMENDLNALIVVSYF